MLFAVLGYFSLIEIAFIVYQGRELAQMLENRVFLHAFLEAFVVGLLAVRKNGHINLFEATQGVDWASFSFWCFEEIFGPRVQSLVRVFARSASASSTRGRISEFAVRSFGVLLLHVSI